MSKVEPIRVTVGSPFRRLRYGLLARIHSSFIGLALRIALSRGYVVVLIGGTRSGKSVVLDRMLPGRIVSKRKESYQGFKPGLQPAEIPSGTFAIDDVECLDPVPLSVCLRDLADRQFVLSIHSSDTPVEMGFAEVIQGRKRLEITLAR